MQKSYKRAWVVVALTGLIMLGASGRINSRRPDPARVTIDPALAAPPRVSAIINQHCADCHSDATRWPWYAHIPPASWVVRSDVNHAKRALNFSQPLLGQNNSASAGGILAAICNMAKSGAMPPWRYRLLHPNSALNANDQVELCQWMEAEIPRLQGTARSRTALDHGR